MGAAYRASGRTSPVMDGLAFHPYADSSGQSPDAPHPKATTIGLADYDRLIQSLTTAFDGTPQAGSTLPILYDEFGVESRIPAGKAKGYTGAEPSTTKPVDEITQGQYYGRALQLAFCQPNVVGILLFHSQDEPALASWQSGVYYDGRHTEVEPVRRPGRARPRPRRLDRPLRRAGAGRRPGQGALPDPVRADTWHPHGAIHVLARLRVGPASCGRQRPARSARA